jgi:mRNA-degrading endonuclease RelE of RelBE toxin-antitoxin system
MRTRIKVEAQVENFVKSIAPEPRRALRPAIKGLAQNRGDIKRLEGKLSGFHRLRVGHYRVIFAERVEKGFRVVECLFARERPVVYDMFLKLRLEEIGYSPDE